MTVVEYAVDEHVARITLNRPERGNGINRALLTELERCVEQADLDPAVHVVVLAGNGKGFCGGYDLVESAEGQGRLEDGGASAVATVAPPGSPLDAAVMRANHEPGSAWDPMVDHAMMSRNVRAFMSLYHCGKPVVCKVLRMMKLLVNQSLYSQGLHATQVLGTVFDGLARHTAEGYAFQGQAAREGFRAAVLARDQPFGDPGASTFKG